MKDPRSIGTELGPMTTRGQGYPADAVSKVFVLVTGMNRS